MRLNIVQIALLGETPHKPLQALEAHWYLTDPCIQKYTAILTTPDQGKRFFFNVYSKMKFYYKCV